MARIPVPDVTDLGDATPTKLRAAGFDMGPGNPRIVPGGSVQAENFRAQQAANVGPQPPAGFRQAAPGVGTAERMNTLTDRVKGVNARQNAAIVRPIERAAQGVRDFGTATKAVTGAAGNLIGAVAANPIARAAGGLVAGKFAIDDAQAADAAYGAGDTTGAALHGLRSGVTAASMLPGPVGLAAGGGLLAGAAVDKGLQQFESGRWLRDKIGGALAGEDARAKVAAAEDFARGGSGAVPPRALPAPPVTPGPLDTRSFPGPTSPALAPVTADAPGTFRYADGSTGTGTVTSLDTREGFRQDQMELGRLRAERAEREAGFGGGLGGFGGATLGSDLRAKTDAGGGMRELMRGGMSARQAGAFLNQQASIAEQARSADQNAGVQMASINSGANTAARSNAVTMRGQDISADTSLRNADLGADVTMRGQDRLFEANRATARLAAENARREQSNWQATHNAGRSDAAFTQGQQAIKDLHTQVAGWIPPVMQDGKAVPDTETAARYATAIQTAVGRMGKTMKDLDETDKGRLIAGMQLTDVANATATGSMTPWGTRAIQSNEPILALRKVDGGYQTNRKGVNGETEVIPARYIEKEGSTWGMGGRPTNRFAQLIDQGNKK